jgi:hypothetical protein
MRLATAADAHRRGCVASRPDRSARLEYLKSRGSACGGGRKAAASSAEGREASTRRPKERVQAREQRGGQAQGPRPRPRAST